MFKKSSKILFLIGSLLLAQCNPIKADQGNYSAGHVSMGLAAIGIVLSGCVVVSAGLQKCIKATLHETGFKKYVGYGVLATTSAATLMALPYGLAKFRV